jgi:predicted AlkP superfamily pyrophosphatase or phosphodiesterase
MNTSKLSILLLACSIISASADYVIFISSDGMRPDAVRALGRDKAPNLHRMRKEGAFTDNARTDATYTVTLPNHTGMMTSRGVVGKTGHEWISNSDPTLGNNLHRNKKDYVASMFDVAHDNGLSTALYASKSKFSLYDDSYSDRWGAPDIIGEDNGKDKIDTYLRIDQTITLVAALTKQLRTDPANLTMLHLRDPDTAGHAHGWIIEGDTPYLESISRVDALIGTVLDTIEDSGTLRGKTTVIVTADHGGLTKTKGHGEAKESDNYTIPFYVWGPGINPATDLYKINPTTRTDPGTLNPAYTEAAQPIRNADAGNLILSLLKLPAIPGSTVNAKQDLKLTE